MSDTNMPQQDSTEEEGVGSTPSSSQESLPTAPPESPYSTPPEPPPPAQQESGPTPQTEVVSGAGPASQQAVEEQQPPPPIQIGQQQPREKARIRIPHPRILLSVIVFLILAFAVLQFTHIIGPQQTTTTSASTTISQITATNINSCTTINKPGAYFLTSSINTSILQGACIRVISSNVRLVGNDNAVTGSGPYSGVPPYTYGIELYNVSNVTVTNFKISRFSYGIYVHNTTDSRIMNNNITQPTLSGIYLSSSQNNTIENNYVAGSDSKQGGMYVQSGSKNKILNNRVANNAYYGLVINSTNNTFSQNYLYHNPVDLVCNSTSAFRYSNNFSNSTCSVNNYCEFARCTTNIPFNLSQVSLQPGDVYRCGLLSSSGTYVLRTNLSTMAYLNFSNPLAKKEACIEILAPNVNFTCNGKRISDSGYGISILSAYNVTVSNCTLTNNTYGIYSKSSFGLRINNVSISKSNYGLFLENSLSGKVNNTNLMNNNFGVYINSTNGFLFNYINAHGNKYGVYDNSGGSNIFNGGAAANNSKADVYCSPSTYNSTDNLFQNVVCGITDCSWAVTCKEHVLPALISYPVSGCMAITSPGNYSLINNIVTTDTCFNIKTSNVTFNCNNHEINGNSKGTVFVASKESNITISNCNINQFESGVDVSDSEQINLNSLTISNVLRGVVFSNVTSSNIANTQTNSYTVAGFVLSRLKNSTVTRNSAGGGSGTADGFVFSNSTKNQVSFNNAGPNPDYGIALVNSINNNVFNNTAFSNSNFDYYCSASSGGFYSESLGINFGLTKNTCRWLVEIPRISFSSCLAIVSPEHIVLSNDMLYTYGHTCFTLYNTNSSSANNTILDCNGHTIFANNGGTFVNIANASSVEIENCYIRNFTTAISVTGSHAEIINNTISYVNTSVIVTNTNLANIVGNRIENSTHGIVAINANDMVIKNNNLYSVVTGIALSSGSTSSIRNNTASGGSVGFSLTDTTTSLVQDNSFLGMSSSGMICSGASANQISANRDLGGNVCSSNRGCGWMTSPMCRAQ